MNALEKLKVQKALSMLTIAMGLVLLTYMIYAESEPGAIPLLLVVLGTGWYLISRARIRSHHKKARPPSSDHPMAAFAETTRPLPP